MTLSEARSQHDRHRERHRTYAIHRTLRAPAGSHRVVWRAALAIGHAVPVVTLGVLDDRLSTSVLIVGFAAFATAVLTVPVRAFRHHGGRLHGEALS
jgi:hypothetical protein